LLRALALLALFGILACTTPPEREATGYVVSVDPDARTATIRHLDLPGVAETMRLPVQSPGVVAGVAPLDHVRLALREREGKLFVVRMAVIPPPGTVPKGGAVPGVHDHSPHHGGIVGMSGKLHLEALARADGTVRVYLTDFYRKPLPLDGVSGRVTLELPAGDRVLALRVADDALEAKGDALADAEVAAHVELTVAGGPVEMDFLLPTTSGAIGAAAVPTHGCVPVQAEAGRRTPRCVLEFGRPITALASTPDGATLLVAAVDAGVSAWRLPEGSLILGFEPPPPITVPDASLMQPHPEGAAAVAVSPDGRQALVALENRLLLYDVASGRLVRELPAAGGVVRGAGWSPDGKSLLVTTFYDPSVRLLRADTGVEWGRLSGGREAASAAYSGDGRLVAVGGESGSLVLSTPTGAESRTFTERGRAVATLAFAGGRLVAGRDGGAVEIWNINAGVLEREMSTRTASPRLSAHGDLLATTGAGGTMLIARLGAPDDPEIVKWHEQDLMALTWAETTLVSGDTHGRVALWTY